MVGKLLLSGGVGALLQTALYALVSALAPDAVPRVLRMSLTAGGHPVTRLPLALLIAFVGHSALAALFLLIRERLHGARWLQGLTYAASLIAVRALLLWLPFPEIDAGTRLLRLVVDLPSLVLTALAVAHFFGLELNEFIQYPHVYHLVPTGAVIVAFFVGRLLRPLVLDMAPLYGRPLGVPAIMQLALVAFIIGILINWYHNKLPAGPRVRTALRLGGLMFGVNRLLLVPSAIWLVQGSPLGFLLAALWDVLFVTAGALVFFPDYHRKEGRLMTLGTGEDADSDSATTATPHH